MIRRGHSEWMALNGNADDARLIIRSGTEGFGQHQECIQDREANLHSGWDVEGFPRCISLKRRRCCARCRHNQRFPEQIALGLIRGDDDDRSLLPTGRQRCQQSLLARRPMHTQVLQTPLKLVEFQLHGLRLRRRYPVNMQQAESGIAHRETEVSPHPP